MKRNNEKYKINRQELNEFVMNSFQIDANYIVCSTITVSKNH